MVQSQGNQQENSSWYRLFSFLLVLILLALIFSIESSADVPGYKFTSVRTMLGPCCTDQGNDLVVDSDGGILIVGSRGGLDLDRDGSVDLQTYGSPDSLVLKAYEDKKDGWVKGPGGPKADNAHAVASDGAGGAYVVGDFLESMEVSGSTIRSAGKKDGFLIRYNQEGEVLWAKAMGGVGYDGLVDVASDSKGNVFVLGTIRGEIDLDRDGSIDVKASGESSLLLASFSSDGELRWAKASGGKSYTLARTIAVGPRGEIYIGGLYGRGAPDLNGDGILDGPQTEAVDPASKVTPQTDMNAFFARFDSLGKMVWVSIVAGPGVQVVGSLTVAKNGDLLVLGGATGSMDLDANGTIEIIFKSMGDRIAKHQADGNTFLLRVDSNGKRVWARRFMGGAKHVAVSSERIVVSGTYNGKLDLDDDGKLERESDNDPREESFAAILKPDGSILHVFTIVGGDSDVANAAGFSPDGKRLYVTGYSKLGADFDNDGKVESASACHQLGDFFLAFYDVDKRKNS